jgi:hypothetical protein
MSEPGALVGASPVEGGFEQGTQRYSLDRPRIPVRVLQREIECDIEIG